MARGRALTNLLNMASEEEMPVEKAFLLDLKYAIEKQEEQNEKIPTKSYKPSSLNCIRNMWFQMMGEQPVNKSATAEFVGICESGTDRHERLQRGILAMKEFGIDCEYVDVATYIDEMELHDTLEVIEKLGVETKLRHVELNLRFLCDGIIKYKGTYYILEIKTEISNKNWKREGIDPSHILQGTTYSLCFGIDKVLYVYENRDNCSKKSFMLEVTDSMKEDVINKIKTCDEYVAQAVCPPKPLDIDKKTCQYCNYVALCRQIK